MRSARLSLALETGLLTLPSEGTVAVYRPRAGDDLSDLPKARVRVLTGFKPDADWFTARGYAVNPSKDGLAHAAAIVCLPRSREGAQALLARAEAEVAAGGPVAVDGQKSDGVDSILKDLRGRVALSDALSKAHGKIAVFPAGRALQGWRAAARDIGGFATLPGVFSADGIDRGSAMLAEVLPPDLKGKVADLGAGWGFLSRVALQSPAIRELHLVEAEADALDCARANIDDPRAVFHWADATAWKAPVALDAVIMNPPFHTGRDADPALGAAFIAAAARLLHPQGVLWMVANRHLPYDRSLTALFRDVQDIGGDAAFRLVRASHPLRDKQRGKA